MPIHLNEQQQRALDSSEAHPPQVVDPRTNAAYVLIPLAEYEAVREIAEDERLQRDIRAVALRNAVRRMDEARIMPPKHGERQTSPDLPPPLALRTAFTEELLDRAKREGRE